VTVNVVDNDNATDSDSASATVTITNTPGQIRVTKTASPTTLSEPGGMVTFTVLVENLSTVDSVTLQRLSDVVEGGTPINLDGVGTCDVPRALAKLGGGVSSYSCSFQLAVTGNADDSRTDVVRAAGIDDDGELVFDDDDATVNFTDAAPAATLTKTVTSVVASYEIVITNESAAEALYVTSLLDDKFGELIGTGKPCGETTIVLAPKGQAGDSHTCSFDKEVTESPHTNTVEATASDDEGTDITPKPSDDATVTFE
jgi:hypothetical protein